MSPSERQNQNVNRQACKNLGNFGQSSIRDYQRLPNGKLYSSKWEQIALQSNNMEETKDEKLTSDQVADLYKELT